MLIKNLFKLFSLLFIIIISITLSACTQNNANSLESIKARGKIVLGTSGDYPPYEFHKEIDGQDSIVGFDIEIAKEIAKDLGVELEIKDMAFGGLLAALDSGNVDFVLAGMTPTPDRAKNVNFSNIYYTAIQAVIVRSGEENSISTIEQLNGKKVGVQKGSIQEELAKSITGVEIKALGKLPDLILELKNNKVAALIVELPVANAYAENNTDLAISSIDFPESDGGSAVAIKKGNNDLTETINQTLNRLIEQKLIDKFVSDATNLVE